MIDRFRSARTVGYDGLRPWHEIQGIDASRPRLISATLLRSRLHRYVDRLRGQQNVERLVALGLEVGERSFISDGVYIDPGRPWLVSIGEDTIIAPFAMLFAHDASMRIHAGYTRLARVRVGSRVYIGAGAILLPGCVIGDDCVVGAGAIVSGEVPAGKLVVGNPARVVRDVSEFAAEHRRAAEQGPTWPWAGWSLHSGITGRQRAQQREALTTATSGYLHAREEVEPRKLAPDDV